MPHGVTVDEPDTRTASQLDYWRTALAGLPERHDLPYDRPPGSTSGPRGSVSLRLPPDLRLAVGRYAQDIGGTVGTVLRAGIAALLTRLGSGTDLPLGVPGPNTVVLRVDTGGEPSFAGLCRRVLAAETAAFARRGVALADVAAAVDEHRPPGRGLFQVGVSMFGAAGDGELWFDFRPCYGKDGSPGGLALTVHHAADLFSPAAARSIAQRAGRLLASALAAPGLPLSTHDILLPQERHALLRTWNDTTHPLPDRTLPAWFERQVAATPDAVALRCAGHTWTYAELNARVNRLARLLIAAGVGPERVVALLLPRSDLAVTGFLAVLKAGGVYLPVDPELPAGRIALMIADAEPTVVLTADDTDALAPDDVRRLTVHAALLDTGEAEPDPIVRGLTDDTPAYLLYTSGSTGRPKGVLMAAGAVLNLMAWHLHTLPSGPGRTTAQFAALSFDPTIQEFLGPLLSGGTLAVPPEHVRRDPAAFVDWLAGNDVTDLFAPNVVVDALCRAAARAGTSLPALSHIAQGGEALVLHERLKSFCANGRVLHNLYGPTETHAATAHRLAGPVDEWPAAAPIGRPIWNTRVHVLDERLRPVPPDVAGELYVAGRGLARGYHRQPARTAERFLPDPFGPPGTRMYRTGDVVRRRADGVLEYLGRADDQVKIRGVRVEPGEIEAAARRVDGVWDVAVVVSGTGEHRRLDAYLVPGEPTGTDDELAARVRSRLADSLPAALVPATFSVLPALPTNANGKVDRLALATSRSRSHAGEPATGTQRLLCRLAADVLATDRVGVRDNFFALGGNSLLAAELVGRIRTDLGAELTIRDLLLDPTVAGWADRMAGALPARPPVRPEPRPEPLPASFAQQSLWVVDALEGPSARYNEPFTLRLSGRLDVPALRRALTDVVGRHEALRTLLRLDGATVTQHVLPAEHAEPALDLVQTTEDQLGDTLRSALARTFDLATELPTRATLCRLDADEHVLLVVTHHVACDGASARPYWRDLATAYDARVAGAAPDWAPLPVCYADYGLWQRRLLDPDLDPAGVVARQRDFWSAALAGMPDVSPLPTDRPRPQVRSVAGGRLPVAVPARTHAGIAELARRHDTTVFTVVHAALTALLTELGAGCDVAVGAVVSGRTDPALADLVGFFANTVVLRVDTSGEPDRAELLDRAREADLAAFAHQDLPLEHVVELVNPVRCMAHQPLAQVMLAFQVRHGGAPALTGLETRFDSFDTGIAKFDLCLDLVEEITGDGPAGLTGWLDHATDVFDTATVARMRDRLQDILAEFAR